MSDRLYNLLPAIYRIRDAEHGEPLRALFGIIEEQFEVLERDIGGLYDDWFIETCSEWVVPYIGDLLGVRMLHNVESGGVYSQRAFVANAIRHRRRKGTLLMLEDLARDVSGWSAHAVAFFELLGWTQHLNHLRLDAAPNPNPRSPEVPNPPAVNRVGTVNLRSLDVVDRVDGPFDALSHTVDVRQLGQSDGWHNIRNVGLFLWRLQAYPLTAVEPRRSEVYPDGFHFSPLGSPAPLFTNPERKTDDRRLATEVNVPGPIRPVAFFQQPEAFYGHDTDMSLAVYHGTAADPADLIALEQILCKDLSTWSPPPPGMVAVDVKLGRLAYAPGEAPAEGPTVSYHYGFSADIGGGPYDRRTTLEKAGPGDWEVVVAKEQPDPAPAQWRKNVAAALDDWDPAAQPRAVITIADNGTYNEELTLTLGSGQHLIIQADDRNRPLVRLRDHADFLSVLTLTSGAGEEASLTLNGLLLEGGMEIHAESLGRLEIVHCTLVPGQALDETGGPRHAAAASLLVAPGNAELDVRVEASIVGALRLPEHMAGLTVRDSIIHRPEGESEDPATPRVAIAQDDAGDQPGPVTVLERVKPGPVTVLERVTVLGDVHVRALELASEVVFGQRVVAERRQTGCVRYSYADDLTSITPRRFRCQPDLALENRRKLLQVEVLPAAEQALIRSRVRPDFMSVRYGHPGYGQLSLHAAKEIRTGAEDGAEMGAFQQLKQPQREANLRSRLQEFMPYGLEAGLVFVT
ncbi:MAG: hypothetical protein IMY75_02105 [Chloroflexi bacterium]|nr:hypothetical protein [Chloroflexota bacterium]